MRKMILAAAAAVMAGLAGFAAPVLEARLEDSLSNIAVLKFDLEKLEFVSDEGLNVFLYAQKIMSRQGRMVLMNMSEEVREIFDEACISDILTIV